MADVVVPHFAMPFKYSAGRAMVVEQDSLEDIRMCIETALRTHIGFREEAPDFGTEDTTFQTLPMNTGTVMNQIIISEPRATQLIDVDQSVYPLDTLIISLINVIQQQQGGGI
jgi:hypothetical protein